jgi:hypothetical protein
VDSPAHSKLTGDLPEQDSAMTELDYYDLGDLIEQRFDIGRTDANDDLCARALIGTAIDASHLVPIPLPPEALAAR